jgi:hypothetical protein
VKEGAEDNNAISLTGNSRQPHPTMVAELELEQELEQEL